MENKRYFSYPSVQAFSNIAMIHTVSGNVTFHSIQFSEVGSYKLYLVDEDCIIPDDYYPLFMEHTWVRIYDDTECVACVRGDEIEFWQAGFTVIVRVKNK